MAELKVTLKLLGFFILVSLSASRVAPPPVPAWPDKFTINFDVLVEKYGDDWKSTGTLYYDYNIKTFRADYIDWCLPLFDDGSSDNNDYSCSFFATAEDMFFVNFTASSGKWEDYDCCLFEAGLAAVPPDWMKAEQYNGTDVINDIPVDVWWFPGTSDPSKPCYGYWNAKDELKTPVRFFGLSSLGPTILDYRDFEPQKIPQNIEMTKPNDNCQKKCEPPLADVLKKPAVDSVKWSKIDWPSC